MNMNAQIIQKNGESFAVIPEHFYLELLEKAEEMDDIKEFDLAMIDQDDEEIPSEIVYQLLNGENPLKVWRKFRSLTQTDLAQQADTTQAMIAMIENGKRTGTIDILNRLSEALNINIDDLTD